MSCTSANLKNAPTLSIVAVDTAESKACKAGSVSQRRRRTGAMGSRGALCGDGRGVRSSAGRHSRKGWPAREDRALAGEGRLQALETTSIEHRRK